MLHTQTRWPIAERRTHAATANRACAVLDSACRARTAGVGIASAERPLSRFAERSDRGVVTPPRRRDSVFVAMRGSDSEHTAGCSLGMRSNCHRPLYARHQDPTDRHIDSISCASRCAAVSYPGPARSSAAFLKASGCNSVGRSPAPGIRACPTRTGISGRPVA